MNKEEFINYLKELGIDITEEKLEQLDKYYKKLIEWNEKINLTRIIEQKEVYLKHFYDSLTLTKVINLNQVKTLCDIGTGAGFPGIVLKIVFPNIKVTLIDSLQKRVNFLNEVIKEINLKDIEAKHCRGEEYKGQYEVVTSRAVANIEKLVNYTMHLVSKDGVFIAMKGNLEKELTSEIEKKLKKKYQIVKIEEFYLPIEKSQRSLVVIKNKENM